MEEFVSITETNKAVCYMPGRHRGGRGIAVTIFNLSARRCGWLTPHPAALPLEETWYPFKGG